MILDPTYTKSAAVRDQAPVKPPSLFPIVTLSVASFLAIVGMVVSASLRSCG